jgi:ABC-2 type transport system ATP-binding protein
MTDPAIVVESLAKRFGKVEALRGVDLQVPPSTVLGLLGPNGAGKTTTVRVLTTLLSPDEGRATVAGYDVVKQAEELRHVIGLAGQNAAVDENLTGLENLEMVGRLYHVPAAEAKRRGGEILERFELSDAAHRVAKTYSGGMRRRLDLGASLVGKPSVLFLDEPTTGLDPRGRRGRQAGRQDRRHRRRSGHRRGDLRRAEGPRGRRDARVARRRPLTRRRGCRRGARPRTGGRQRRQQHR